MKIYIADDYWETSNLIVEGLCCIDSSFEFRTARNGKELLNIIDSDGPPDLLTLDLLMPIMDGFGVLREFQNNKAKYDFPILVVTALAEQYKIRQAYELGASDVMVKPFLLDDLAVRVKNLLKRAAEKRELEKSVLTLSGNVEKLQYESLVQLCKVVEAKDGLTGEHIERVGDVSFEISQKMGLCGRTCETIRMASKLHDLGKVAIPDSILQKPGKLTDDEFELVKTHTIRGAEIIKTSSNVILSAAMDIILYHHEHYNGNGYPFGLKNKDIPLPAQITAVADVFDALTHNRVYKKAWSNEQAIEYILQQKSKQFNPEVVDAFLILQDNHTYSTNNK